MTKTSLCATVVLLGCLVVSVQAENGTPSALYSAALARERALRAPGEMPSVDELRAAISAYEVILTQFPGSEFGDHVLWQSSGLAVEAYERFRQQADLERGVRLLRALELGHPTSPFVARVAERRRHLDELTRLAWLHDVERILDGDLERVTVRLDRQVRYRSERLSDPPRLFFDFPDTEAAPSLRNATLRFSEDDEPAVMIRAVRLGRHPNATTRLVLDLREHEACGASTAYRPYRIVVECRRLDAPEPSTRAVLRAAMIPPATVPPLRPLARSTGSHLFRALRMPTPAVTPVVLPLGELSTDDETARRATAAIELFEEPLHLPAPEPAIALPVPSPESELSVARQLGLHVSRVIIDAGHGGHDPGARNGSLTEADIVLDIAHRLADRLRTQAGVEVLMTREVDRYVPLEARTTLANRVGADLFLSIHANASRNPEARGVETYFLNLAADPKSERVAARENQAAGGAMNDLDRLLRTIAASSKVDESREFAETVQRALLKKLQRADPEMPDLGVKQAPFMVLIGARMPSILTEISFVTNSRDATLLAGDAYRALIADGLFEGVLRYQRSLVTSPLVARQTAADGF